MDAKYLHTYIDLQPLPYIMSIYNLQLLTKSSVLGTKLTDRKDNCPVF